MTMAVEITDLRKVYRGVRRRPRVAVDSLNLTVEAGRVHGFLGPNGSGKTTTIRALLGLIRADAGHLRLLGYDVPRDLPRVIGRVGAVVESPQFFPHFSGRRNLALLAGVAGIKRRRVDEVLEIVGLRDRARDRVRGYSLGMRQRLAIAATLLKEPALLILDEPNNGLDPGGIREIRDLMRTLADSGVTVVLSSHILAEVQHVCDAVSIISQGRHVVTGPVSEVLKTRDPHEVRVRVADPEYAISVLSEAGLPVERDGDHLIVSDIADPSWITQTLARRRLFVSELIPVIPDLESVFLELTGTRPVPGERLQIGQARTGQPTVTGSGPAVPVETTPPDTPKKSEKSPAKARMKASDTPRETPTKTLPKAPTTSRKARTKAPAAEPTGSTPTSRGTPTARDNEENQR